MSHLGDWRRFRPEVKAIRGQAVGFEEGHADARCVRAQAGEAEGLLAQVGRLRCACGVLPIPAMRCWAHILTHVWLQDVAYMQAAEIVL